MNKRKVFSCSCWAVLFLTIVWTTVSSSSGWSWSRRWLLRHSSVNVACAKNKQIHGLDSAEVKLGESVFFIVSSDIYDNTTVPINARQACGIEAAAKHHHEKDIYVVIVTPDEIPSLCLHRNPVVGHLLQYPNVKLRTLHARSFLEETPARCLLQPLEGSSYPVEHTSDILRYALLHRFGGLYLDTDVIMLRRMPSFGNFVGAETNQWAGAGVFHFGMDRVGREMANQSLEQLIRSFNGDEYSTSGPKVISEVLYRRCQKPRNLNQLLDAKKAQECDGFLIAPSYVFYGVPFMHYDLYFAKGQTAKVLKMLENSTTIHYWNHMTYNMAANEPNIPFYDIAQIHCPAIFNNTRHLF